MTQSRRITWLLIVVAVGALSLLLFLRPAKTIPGDTAREKIHFGLAGTDPSALLFHIASDRGFFAARGLDLTISDYSSGVLATEEMLKGRLDAVTASEFVTANHFFHHPELRILASIARLDSCHLVARKDRGIFTPADLAGKRIAVTRNSGGEFFLETFLGQQGIPMNRVKLVDLPLPGMQEAIASGKVDAVLAWGPQVDEIRERLGENAVYWSAQGGRGYYMLVLTRADVVQRSPRASERLLAALVEAEEVIAARTPEVKRFMTERLGYRSAFLESLWPHWDFCLRLDQDLLILMEDEAKWALRHKRQQGKIPNYLGSIHWGSMEKVRPEAVSIVH